jgi:RimJ/RimL family protein N-acetyltransferase
VRVSLTAAQQGGRNCILYVPNFEGRGFATEMAQHLIEMAQATVPGIRIFAFTLPEKNAPNHILQKLGFDFAGETCDEDNRVVWRWELAQRPDRVGQLQRK